MGLETGPHCIPTFEGSWLCFLYAFYILFRSLSPQTFVSDHHLSPIHLSLLMLLLILPQLTCILPFWVFLIFRKLCQLLIVLDSWALSLRSQALRKNPEIQAQRP